MAGAASHLRGGDSEYQGQSRAITCPRSVLLALRAVVLESFTSGPHGGAEMYGILFGTQGDNEVQIAEFQAIDFQSAMAGATPLSMGERQAFAAALWSTARSDDPKRLEPVGWFRAHPHSELSLTARDLEIGAAFFPAPYQVVMILRPSESLQSLVRFFYRDAGGALTADSPFCEFDLPPTFEVPPRPINVPEVRKMPRDVPQTLSSPEAAPRELAASPELAAPPELDQPSERDQPPALNEPADLLDDAIMYLPEPPLPNRSFKLVWPLLVVSVLGLLGAWYWLAQPAEKLALRVFDAGGQLKILWEPVSNGEVGTLEITDGGARYSITLDPEQLRSGMFTYARHTQNVSVRLEASRHGGGALTETARFREENPAPTDVNAPPDSGSASRAAQPKPVPEEKPTEIVVSVPVTAAPAPRPKFSEPAKVSEPVKFKAPVMRASGSANRAPDLSAPPLIAQNAAATVLAPVQTLSPPAEKPAPPPAQPAIVPAQAAAAKPVVTPTPTRTASAPPAAISASGRIIWIGRLQRNQEVAINGKTCSTGTLIGQLPGKPVKFSVSPGDLSNDGIVLYTANSQYANSVIESPGAQNGWNKTIYTWNPKYANDVAVKEAPAAQNQWNRVVLQSKNPKISVMVIDWALIN